MRIAVSLRRVVDVCYTHIGEIHVFMIDQPGRSATKVVFIDVAYPKMVAGPMSFIYVSPVTRFDTPYTAFLKISRF
jgi:hypothetical protein